jgi:high-affinity nickel-transport protein
MLDVLTSSGLGSLLGMRHALEPDHLAAVSTLVARERGVLRGAWLGLCWGAGHTLALLAVGLALVFFQTELPPSMARFFESGVAIMLVVLGLRAVRQAVIDGTSGPDWFHRHGLFVHHHPGGPAHVHIGRWTLARRPLLIGAVHGLAGSGALTALVLATLPSTTARLSYMLLFGLGSMTGMAALSGLLGWPLARLGAQHSVARAVTLLVGCASTALGVFWGYRLL